MQTNTPAPVQRNRRAGRLSPIDPVGEASPQTPVQSAPVPQPTHAAPVQPAENLRPLHPTAASVPQYRPATPPAAVQPGYHPSNGAAYPCYTASQPQQVYANPASVQQPVQTAARSAYASVPVQHAYSRQASDASRPASNGPSAPQPRTQAPVQPTARRTTAAPVPTQTCSVPAGTRPQAAPVPARMRHDDPDARRAAAKAARPAPPPEKAAAEKPRKDTPRRRTTPSWLKSILSLMLVVVMALIAGTAVMMATLKTKADEQQKAWENILFNYHLTEQADGALRVTWQDLIEHYAAMYNLDPAFVTAVIRNESSFRTDAVSSVGARGLMQMMPDTAEWIAGKLDDHYDFDRLFDAETAIRYGCWYLGYLADLFGGDTVLVCAAYHAGQGEVLGWLGDSDISPDGVSVPISNIPISNTRTYAERVTKAYGVYDALLYPDAPAQTPDVPGTRGADARAVPVR